MEYYYSKKFFSILALSILFLIFILTPSFGASVNVTRSQAKVATGDTILLSAGVLDSFDQETDIYIWLILPGIDEKFFIGPDLGFYINPTPIVKNWVPFEFPPINLLEYTFTGLEPDGEYSWAGVLTIAGSSFQDSAQHVGNENIVTFSFEKQDSQTNGIIDWLPQNGAVLSTDTPDIFLKFREPVNTESIIQNIELSIVSLSSGKSASVAWIDGERWITLEIPDIGTISTKVEDDSFIQTNWSENNTKVTYHVDSYTLYGQTFKLNYGVSYSFSVKLKEGALSEDGTSITQQEIGPITFSITD